MNRSDGTGSRLFSLINAMYLAQKLSSIDNMRFLWDEKRFIDKADKADCNNTQMKNFGDNIIIGASCENKEAVFQDEFIKKHYLEKYDSSNQIAIINDFNKLKSNYEKCDYLKVGLSFLDPLFPNKKNEYRLGLSNCWDNIPFASNLQHMIKKAKEDSRVFDNNFIAIHLRSGDAIYTYAPYRLYNRQSTNHATPYEFALGIIKQHKDEQIVIIGDDVSAMRELKAITGGGNVKYIEDFRVIDEYSNLELFIYDVVFMSRAKKLYGTHSALVKLAYSINPNLEWIHPHNHIDKEILYKWLRTYYDDLKNLSSSQRAFSNFHLYMHGLACNEKIEILEQYLKNALEFDPENDKYRIHLLGCLLKRDENKQADDLLKEYLSDRYKEFNATLHIKYWSGKYAFEELFAIFLQHANAEYPYLSLIAGKISEMQNRLDSAIKYYLHAKFIIDGKNSVNLIEYLDNKYKNLNNLQKENTDLKTKLEEATSNLNTQIKNLTNQINSLPIQEQTLKVENLKQDLAIKQLQTKKLEKELGISQNSLKELEAIKAQIKSLECQNKNLIKWQSNPNLATANSASTAKSRIQSQLTYKLGRAMIENSKSIWGYIRMPYVLSYIKEQHQKEQKAYNAKIKANPSLKLPPLESYPDYQDALKEKECLTYKLGTALIEADKSPLKLGYLGLWFKCKAIQKSYKK